MDPMPTCIVAEDSAGGLRALAFLRVTAETGVLVSTGMRAQSFDAALEDVIEDLAIVDLWEKLQRVRNGKITVEPIEHIRSKARDFLNRYTMLRLSTVGDAFVPASPASDVTGPIHDPVIKAT
jgi:hypothetical protein